MSICRAERVLGKSVSGPLWRLRLAACIRRISLSNFPTAFAGWILNLLDQVGGGLENPHWRGERVILLPLSAFFRFLHLTFPSQTLLLAFTSNAYPLGALLDGSSASARPEARNDNP